MCRRRWLGSKGIGCGRRPRTLAPDAYRKFARAAQAAGLNIMPISGYRSFSQQASLYDSHVRQYEQATTDTFAARPGHSEHQTGLAMDTGNTSGICALQACFAPAGKWAAEHGWEYGFIIRYSSGADATTGYTYEPWHLRVVGRDIALEMESAGIAALEGYFGLKRCRIILSKGLLATTRFLLQKQPHPRVRYILFRGRDLLLKVFTRQGNLEWGAAASQVQPGGGLSVGPGILRSFQAASD